MPILHSLFVLFEYNLCPSMQDKNSKSSCYAFFLIPVHQKPSIEILWINLCSLLFQCLFPCAIHLTLRRVEPDTFLHIRYAHISLNQGNEGFKTRLERGIWPTTAISWEGHQYKLSLYWLSLPLHFFQNYRIYENSFEIDLSKVFSK